MRAIQLLHNLLQKAVFSIDKRIQKTLFLAVEALAEGRHLSISGLGRVLASQAKVKHCIKRIDRLFGNKRLHQQTKHYYQAVSHRLISGRKRPVILVDWSGLTKCGGYHFLRASLAVNGRALTLYEEAHPLKAFMSDKAQREFLRQLKELLPIDCQPIIVTDAGFRNPWFKQVRQLGWDFVGRVRSKVLYTLNPKQPSWKAAKTLYDKATTKAQFIGEGLLAKSRPIACHFYLMKQRKKYRVKKNLAGKKVRGSSSLKHAKREAEPWLLVSSLSPDKYNPNQVINCYKKRMQIEQAFRDIKNTRHGFGLRHCRSFSKQRLQVALLIAMLATFYLWLIGTAVKQQKLHFSFQANSIKNKNILSNFIIGWQAIRRKNIKISMCNINSALKEINACA